MQEYAALIRALVMIGAASALFIGGCHYGVTKTENASMKADQKVMAELADKLEEERRRASGLSEQIRTLLDRPAARDTIREIVKTNPSNCVRPAAVNDGLRREIDSANQAIAASRGGNTLPQHSADRNN